MGKRVVKQFVIGVDFSAQEIELLVLQIAEWFRSEKCDRRHDDPLQAAREVVAQCLNATTKSGDPWKNAPDDFKNRIKIKAAYNMETGEGIPIAPVKNPDAVRALEKGAEKNESKINQMNPLAAKFDVEKYRAQKEKELVEAYPDLATAAMLPHVRRCTLLYAQQEMIDMDLALVTNANKRADLMKTLETVNKTLDNTLNMLDIHPDQIRRRVNASQEGNLGELVSLLDGDEFREREELWNLQLALQLWSMTIRRNGRGDGPQLEMWELWHMTRSVPFAFTCRCGEHYPHLLKGFTPKQLKEYLESRGVVITKSIYPKIVPQEAVQDLDTFIDSLPESLTPKQDIQHDE